MGRRFTVHFIVVTIHDCTEATLRTPIQFLFFSFKSLNMTTATYQILFDRLHAFNISMELSFVIVQDNAHVPSVLCLVRARRARWQSVPRMESKLMAPKRTSTPPSGAMFQGLTTVTSQKTRNLAPCGTNTRAFHQPSLPRVPRRNSKTELALSQRMQEQTPAPTTSAPTFTLVNDETS